MKIADKTILITGASRGIGRPESGSRRANLKAAVPAAGGNHDDLVTPRLAADCVACLNGHGR